MRDWRTVRMSELQRPMAVVVASLLVISIASVGQVQSEIDKDNASRAAQVAAGSTDDSPDALTEAAGTSAEALMGLAALIRGEIDAEAWVAGLRSVEREKKAA